MKKDLFDNLKRKRLNIVLFVTNLFEEYPRLIWNGVTEKAKQLDVNVVIFKCNALRESASPFPYDFQNNIVYHLASPEFIDGIIIATSSICSNLSSEEINRFLENFKGIPIVSIAMELPHIPSILADNSTGIIQLIHHLAEDHHKKRIAFIKGPENNPDGILRYNAYLQGLKEVGIDINPELVLNGAFQNPAERKLSLSSLITGRWFAIGHCRQ